MAALGAVVVAGGITAFVGMRGSAEMSVAAPPHGDVTSSSADAGAIRVTGGRTEEKGKRTRRHRNRSDEHVQTTTTTKQNASTTKSEPPAGSVIDRGIEAMGTRTLMVALLGAALTGGVAAAQNADAEALFIEGNRLEVAGRVAEACEAFEASNRIEPRAGTLIRLGQCREKQRRFASAWSAYKDSLTRVKDPNKRAIAEAKVKELEPRLSYLTVLVPDDSRVDGLVIKRNGTVLDPMLWNRAAPVDGGTYTISGEAPGHEPWSTTVEVGDEMAKASVEVPKFKELRKLIDDPSVGDETDEDSEGLPSGMFTTQRKVALGVGAAGILAAAAGVVLGMGANGLSDDAFALCPDPASPCSNAAKAQDMLDRAHDRALYANIAFGAAGVAVIGAAILWFTGAPSGEETGEVAIGGRIGNGSAGFDVSWRF